MLIQKLEKEQDIVFIAKGPFDSLQDYLEEGELDEG